MRTFKYKSDQELLSLIREGEARAFEEIYFRYDSLLYIYAFRKLGDKQEAQDVVQEVFTGLWNSRQYFKLELSLSGYLYKSVLNKIFNIFKHKKIIQRYIDSQENWIFTGSEETDYLIREKDLLLLIDKEIAAMPPRMREVFELKRKYYLTTKEIAEQLQISEFTVSTQMKRALKVLKIKLRFLVFIAYVMYHYM